MKLRYTQTTKKFATDRKLFLTIIVFGLLSLNAEARNFYFSTSTGDDTRTSIQAQNPATPWKTIAKANSSSSIYLPGDSLLFKRGDIFTLSPGNSLSIQKSGTAVNPIVVGAYGTGSKPIFTSYTTITGWNNYGNGIYYKDLVCESEMNPSYPDSVFLVTVDGNNTARGRFPNSGWLTYESTVYGASSTFTDNQLTSNPNWTESEAVIRKNK